MHKPRLVTLDDLTPAFNTLFPLETEGWISDFSFQAEIENLPSITKSHNKCNKCNKCNEYPKVKNPKS